NVSLPIKLDKGHLVMTDASLDMAGGKITGNIDANAASKAVAIKGALKGMTAEALAKAYKMTEMVTGGPLDASVDVRGSGASPHAIATNLSGAMLASMGESKIRNAAMGGAQGVLQIITAAN